MINIYLGSINRSGGSLFCRLLDGHPDVASYPIELGFPANNNIAPFIENITGFPHHIPHYDKSMDIDYLDFLGLAKVKKDPVYKWQKEHGDSVGVRKNYLEKEFYGKVKTDFDYPKFIVTFLELANEANSFEDLWNARHKAYFSAWEDNKYAKNMKYVVTHNSGGLYLSNIENFFNEFESSFYVYPLRSIFGFISSEKVRLARRFYGSRRFPKIKMPNYFVKVFSSYDLKAQINAWMSALTRVVILQEKFGVHDRFLLYRYENLVRDPKSVIEAVCKTTGLKYDPCLLTPTIAGQPWGGSSQQGKQAGINPQLTEYYREVLTQEEISTIYEAAGEVLEFLEQIKTTPTDLTSIPKKILYDYDFQKRYFDDEEKMALYNALVNSGRRKYKIGKPSKLAVFALAYSELIRIIHIPRLIKQRYFPGLGRQNYT
jgi:hypothetical protein